MRSNVQKFPQKTNLKLWSLITLLPFILIAQLIIIPFLYNLAGGGPRSAEEDSFVTFVAAIIVMLSWPAFLVMPLGIIKLVSLAKKHTLDSKTGKTAITVLVTALVCAVVMIGIISQDSSEYKVQKEASSTEAMPKVYVRQEGVAKNFKASITFDPNAEIATHYLKGSESNGEQIGHIDKVIWKGKELNSQNAIEVSVARLSAKIVEGALKCSNKGIGTSATYFGYITVTTYTEAMVMGKKYSLCGTSRDDIDSYIQDSQGNWYRAEFKSGSDRSLDTSIVKQIAESIDITPSP